MSGSDEIKMRWEYCTKMTFNRNGNAEWHSWATYRNKELYKKLFLNYVVENSQTKTAQELDPNQHFLEIDLAIYDEI
jgi:hypothetical protein